MIMTKDIDNSYNPLKLRELLINLNFNIEGRTLKNSAIVIFNKFSEFRIQLEDSY